MLSPSEQGDPAPPPARSYPTPSTSSTPTPAYPPIRQPPVYPHQRGTDIPYGTPLHHGLHNSGSSVSAGVSASTYGSSTNIISNSYGHGSGSTLMDPVGGLPNSLQIVPIQPSVIATPSRTYPGSEMEVTILIRESEFKHDDWLGLFKIHQFQSTKSITQRQVSKLHFTRMTSNTERFRKLTCRFYAPKHAGLYTFRYFHALEYWPLMSSNEVQVKVGRVMMTRSNANANANAMSISIISL